jgi:GH25 family lysozyme M1 (1,4-beta-N-acetylmuramidase)
MLITIFIIGGTYISLKVIRKYQIKNAVIKVVLEDNLTAEFNTKVKVSNFIKEINGNIVKDYLIDTTKLGEKEVSFVYINDDNIKLKYSYTINVVDTTPPVIWLNSTYSLPVNSADEILDKVLCADNYDSTPNCFIEGDYDLTKVGKYNLTFKAIDSNNNISSKDFILNVYKNSKNTVKNNSSSNYTYFEDVITNYKSDNTKIGLDISAWQGEVDFEAIKEAGVEFVILRVGGTKGRNGDYFLDSTFINNIENANKENIPVGIYFYSYANSSEKAKENANWVLEQIKDYQVELPIAFDWENWNNYNKYHLSFYELSKMADTFIEIINEKGYQGMLYSSKTYLENMWIYNENLTWLAHYTSETNYQGEYKFWQLCDNGKINGIAGTVDIDIMYE